MRACCDEGQLLQYSKTSLRMWGTKAAWPFAGREPSFARKMAEDICAGGTVTEDKSQQQPRFGLVLTDQTNKGGRV